MGTVSRRLGRHLAVAAALAALAAPSLGRATTQTTYEPPSYAAGPKGGDAFNVVMVDPPSGSVTVVRANPVPTNAGLGCGGVAGFGNLKVTHTATGALRQVTVAYEDAVVDPYTFFNVGVRQGSGYLGSKEVAGAAVGSGTITVDLTGLSPAPTGTIEVWFGIQTSSACPNFDGGRARFPRVTIDEDP